jgi:hypothetical protein
MNDSDEFVNLQKTYLWNHQKIALKIRIPEIRRFAIQRIKIAATEMFLAILFFNKYVFPSIFPIPCEQQVLSLPVGRLGSDRGLGMLFGCCQGQP